MSNLPQTPYFAVIFTSKRASEDSGYSDMAKRMEAMSRQQNGFLGIQSVRDANGIGITVSYWRTLEDIANWKKDTEHILAQQKGKSDWYTGYEVRISKVERQYSFGTLGDL